MLYTGLKHSHMLFATLYLVFFIYKLIILFIKDKEAVDRMRNKTKILEMILPTLFLITGVWMAIISHNGQEAWLYIKIVALLAAIATGVMTFKRYNKMLGIITLILFLFIYGLSESKKMRNSFNGQKPLTEEELNKKTNPLKRGEMLYKTNNVMNCINCHGENGDAGLSGAANLITSTIDEAAIHDIISGGKLAMPAYKDKLSEDDIKALTEYVNTLRK